MAVSLGSAGMTTCFAISAHCAPGLLRIEVLSRPQAAVPQAVPRSIRPRERVVIAAPDSRPAAVGEAIEAREDITETLEVIPRGSGRVQSVWCTAEVLRDTRTHLEIYCRHTASY